MNILGNFKFIYKLLGALILISLSSCSKEEDNTFSSPVVEVNFEGIEDPENKVNKQSNIQSSSYQTVQRSIIPLNKDMSAVATLIPQQELRNENSNKPLAAIPKNKELKQGTLFKILVYNSNKDLVEERDYTYKKFYENDPNRKESELSFQNLKINQTYTFIVYSINSTKDLPSVTNKTKLDNATLSNISTQLLYFKDILLLKKGINYLNVRLRHQFSQVVTQIHIDQTGALNGSKLTELTTPRLSPAFENATLKLSNNAFTLNSQISRGKAIPFTITSTGVQTLTSDTLLLITDPNPNVMNTITIPSITINGFNKPISLTNFKILPGVHYLLKVEIGCPCLLEADPSVYINRGSHSSGAYPSYYDYLDADFGAVLDIYELDNSFNFKINEQPIYIGSYANDSRSTQTNTNEIQFQGFNQNTLSDTYPNIEFEDGARWGKDVDGTNEIYQFSGKNTNLPIVRLTITKDGKIAMFGSKKKDGSGGLFPLKLINNTSVTMGNGTSRYIRGRFNEAIKWNSKGTTNKIELSQKVSSTTFLYGHISGKKIVDCRTLK